jgi:prophage antirepressor-like protein
MNNELVKITFSMDNEIYFECWVLKIGNEFWFKAHDVAVFLDYQDTNQTIRKNVPIEGRKQWRELEQCLHGVRVPLYWKPHTIFITEGGLNKLICRSTKPETFRFQTWVFDEVLPTLREKGTYTIQSVIEENDRLVISLNSQLANKYKQLVQLKKSFNSQLATRDRQIGIQKERIANQIEQLKVRKELLTIIDQLLVIREEKISRLEERSAVVPISNETRHVFQLYRNRD